MIRNQREYASALEQRRRLERAWTDYLASPRPDPRMQETLLTSVEAMRGPLEAEIAAYEALRHGDIATPADSSTRSPSSPQGAHRSQTDTARIGRRPGMAELAMRRDEGPATRGRSWRS